MNPVPNFIERAEPTSPYWRRLGIQHLQRYNFALRSARGKSVLDLACGPGFGSYVLARNGASDVTGVDISAEAITYAEGHYRAANLTFLKADGQTFNAPRPYDLAVSFETIEHVPDPAMMVQTLARNLVPGGLLLLSAPNARVHKRRPDGAGYDNPFHLNEPTYDELIAWLHGSFTVLESYEQSPVNFDSAAHLESIYRWRSSILLNGLMKCESLLRKLIGKPWPEQPEGTRLERWTDIIPLLPSRIDQAEVFLLVCQKSD
jgi:SAM-dependent methyltransferase